MAPRPQARSGWRRAGRLLPAGAALALAGLAAACGGASPAARRLAPSRILAVEAASKAVVLSLTASDTSTYGGFNFDGYSAGSLTLRIPVGWTVRVDCHNASTVLTHSCAVIEDVPIAPTGGPLAFPGASTADPLDGIGCGSTASFTFLASRPGRYRIACLVSGHEADGMWDWLVVTSGGQPGIAA